MSEPQQATIPLVLTAQLCRQPAAMAVNVPDGGVDCPSLLRPQQATVPFVLSAQPAIALP